MKIYICLLQLENFNAIILAGVQKKWLYGLR